MIELNSIKQLLKNESNLKEFLLILHRSPSEDQIRFNIDSDKLIKNSQFIIENRIQKLTLQFGNK